MSLEEPEAYLRTMLAPLSQARRGEPLPGVPFSCEAVANAFVMLGLLPEPRAEEILAEHRRALEAKGFRFGVLTGELSIRPGAYGFQDAQAMDRDQLTQVPLAVAAGPVPIPLDSLDLSVTWATLTPRGVKLGFHVTGPLGDVTPGPSRPRFRVLPGEALAEKIRAGLSVTDNLGRNYRVRPVRGGGTLASGLGQPPPRWDGELLAEPEAGVAAPEASEAVRWLEFRPASGPPARIVMSVPAEVATGPADLLWPTAAEGYLAALAQVTSMSISTDSGTAELDAERIVAAVADALLWAGALPPDSALLSGEVAAGSAPAGWRQELMHQWGRRARQRARVSATAGLAARLPLREATAVIETISAHEGLVWITLYGHPWVTGEYWPMITPCFQVRAVDDTGAEHDGVPGSGGGSPEGSWQFWFWPPVVPAARRIRVIVSTLREAARAETDIPGRTA